MSRLRFSGAVPPPYFSIQSANRDDVTVRGAAVIRGAHWLQLWRNGSEHSRTSSVALFCAALWCFAVFCGVLRCFVVLCGILWGFVVFCGVLRFLRYFVVFCGIFWCFVLFCGFLWCFAVFYCILWCLWYFWCFVLFCGILRCFRYFVVFCGIVWCFVLFCGVLRCFTVFCGVLWCFTLCCGVLQYFIDKDFILKKKIVWTIVPNIFLKTLLTPTFPATNSQSKTFLDFIFWVSGIKVAEYPQTACRPFM